MIEETWEHNSKFVLSALQRIEHKQDKLSEKIESTYQQMDGRVDKMSEDITKLKTQAGVIAAVISAIPTLLSLLYNFFTNK